MKQLCRICVFILLLSEIKAFSGVNVAQIFQDTFSSTDYLGVQSGCSNLELKISKGQFLIVREFTRNLREECKYFFAPENSSYHILMHCDVLNPSVNCSVESLEITTDVNNVQQICGLQSTFPSTYIGKYMNLVYKHQNGIANRGFLCVVTAIDEDLFLRPSTTTTETTITTDTALTTDTATTDTALTTDTATTDTALTTDTATTDTALTTDTATTDTALTTDTATTDTVLTTDTATTDTTATPPECSQTCGQSSNSLLHSRIGGGTVAQPKEFPWSVFIIITRSPVGTGDSTEFCGGTLISKRDIVTSAQCIDYPDFDHAIVYLAHRVLNPASSETELAYVNNSFYHENFTQSQMIIKNDIALLHLNETINISSFISPICLPPSNLGSLENQPVRAWGHGYTIPNLNKLSDELLKVDLTAISNAICNTFWQNGILSQHLCAQMTGKGVCRRDTGGGLQYLINGNWYLVGITSFGLACGTEIKPDVYTRVTEFRTWLDENMFSPCI